MGTRGLTAVISKGKPVIAQYGQWDHYPKGQGLTVLNFLKENNIGTFKVKLNNVRFQTEADFKELNEFMASIGSTDGWMNMEQAEKYDERYPFSSRDHGAKILSMVHESELSEIVLIDNYEFAGSLSCAYAYVIDLDAETFEIYRGCNKKPLPDGERFKYLEDEKDGEYYPVKHWKSYSLWELPDEVTFLNDLNEDDK